MSNNANSNWMEVQIQKIGTNIASSIGAKLQNTIKSMFEIMQTIMNEKSAHPAKGKEMSNDKRINSENKETKEDETNEEDDDNEENTEEKKNS